MNHRGMADSVAASAGRADAGMADPGGSAVNIAWVAHLGGFFVGLLLIGLLEKPPLSASGGPGHVDYGEWKNRK